MSELIDSLHPPAGDHMPYDDYLTQHDPGHYPESSGDVETAAQEVRDEQHERCPVCKADMCLADAEGMMGRENCPCDGEGAEPVMACDGQATCSEACRETYEVGA